jgi:hypothetical protein
LAGGGVQQRLRAVQRDGGVAQKRHILLHGGLLGQHVRLERRAFQPIQQRPLFDLGTFVEGALGDERRHPGNDVHLVDRLHAAHEIAGLHHRALRRRHHAHRRRAARAALRRRWLGCRDSEQD